MIVFKQVQGEMGKRSKKNDGDNKLNLDQKNMKVYQPM